MRGWGTEEPGLWLCQMPNFTSNVSRSYFHGRHRFPSSFFAPLSYPFFTFPFLLSFSFSLFLSLHFLLKWSGILIVNPAPVWSSQEYKCKRERAANPARKGVEPNLGAESNTRKESEESIGGQG